MICRTYLYKVFVVSKAVNDIVGKVGALSELPMTQYSRKFIIF